MMPTDPYAGATKKRLLVIVGAGASLDLGMPSVSEFDGLLAKWAADVAYLEDGSGSLYEFLVNRVREFYSIEPKVGLRKETNFEEILFLLLQLGMLSEEDRYMLPLKPFLDLKALPPVVSYGEKKTLNPHLFQVVYRHLVENIVREISERCVAMDESGSAFLQNRTFWETLRDRFELGIFNLNYDNALNRILPGLRTGYDTSTGCFAPGQVHNLSYGFCFPLHGSVHFDASDLSSDALVWREDISKPLTAAWQSRRDTTREGMEIPATSIITGYEKVHQLQREPFLSYYSRLITAAYQADAILFVGYGFGDLHVNNAIFSSVRNRGRIPSCIITRSDDNEDPMQFRHDGWSDGVFMTLYEATRMFSFLSHINAPDIWKLKAQAELETNKEGKCAIWHNGVLSLGDNPDKVMEWLSQ